MSLESATPPSLLPRCLRLLKRPFSPSQLRPFRFAFRERAAPPAPRVAHVAFAPRRAYDVLAVRRRTKPSFLESVRLPRTSQRTPPRSSASVLRIRSLESVRRPRSSETYDAPAISGANPASSRAYSALARSTAYDALAFARKRTSPSPFESLSKASQLMKSPFETNITLNERKYRSFVLEIHRIFNAQRTLRPSHPGPRLDLTEFKKDTLDVHTRFQPVRKSSSSSPTS
ncbi:hypothetical protein EV715DRAFT_297300 [Schizophyllum commune]